MQIICSKQKENVKIGWSTLVEGMKDLLIWMHVFVFVLKAVSTHFGVYVQCVCFWLVYVHYWLCLHLYYKYTLCPSSLQLELIETDVPWESCVFYSTHFFLRGDGNGHDF